jgi:predicted nucleic acid-binding protein
MPWYETAAARLRELAEGGAPWAIPWPCIHEFTAVVTRAGIFDPPTPVPAALDQVDAWRESEELVLLPESGTYWSRFRELLLGSRVEGSRVHDARIAALCLSHGVRELWTVDRDFSRFPGLVTRNPLV